MYAGEPQGVVQDHQREIERNYRYNFVVNALDGGTYWLGYSFIAPTVILPLYISHFTRSPLLIGLIPFLSTASFLLPQLFVSNFVERAPRKKFFPVNLGFLLERVPVMLLPVSVALFAKDQPFTALGLFFLLYAWYSIGAGLIIVGWQDMIAKIIPVSRRGRFFGITQFAGNATGILGAIGVPIILEKFAFPQGYVIAFSTAAVLVFLSWVFLSLTREPAVKPSKPPVSQADYFRTLPQVLRGDPNFSRYLVAQIVFSLGSMANGFLIVYSSQTWNLPDSVAGEYIIAYQVGQAAANLFFGFLSDRKGHKLCLEIGAVMAVISFLIPILSPNPLWFFPVFLLRGAVMAAVLISGMAIVMEFSLPDQRATYIGLANTVPGVASSVAPLVGGWLAGAAGYPVLFILSTILSLAGFAILRWAVREPRTMGHDRQVSRPALEADTSTFNR